MEPEVRIQKATHERTEDRNMSRARCAAAIEPREIAWFWKPYLPRGMLSLLDGDPGCGKSYLTLALAAALSTGQSFPGALGRPRHPRPSLICSAEDPAEEVIVPRLRALGADLSLVHILDSGALDRLDETGKRVLRQALEDLRPHLFTMDTIIPYLPPGVGTQQATDVRPTLRWLAARTSEFSTCGLVLRHLRKAEGDNPLHAGQGTMDFIGTCRSTWLAAIDPTDPSSRVLAHNKTNVSAKGPSWRYGFDADGRFEWRGHSSLSAADLVARRKAARGPGACKTEEAADWLTLALAGGPRLAREIYSEAERAGVSERTLDRAKGELGVVSERTGSGWFWRLPPTGAAVA
jgi:hypothetical protein